MKNKINWDETATVFTQVQVWLTSSMGQSEGGGNGTGTGSVRVEEQAAEGDGPMWGSVVRQICTAQTAKLLVGQAFTCINTLATSSRLLFLFTQPMKMEQTVCSETSAHKIQTPANQALHRVQKKSDRFANHTNDPGWEILAQRRKRVGIWALFKAYTGEWTWISKGQGKRTTLPVQG